jgi:quinoprotein glucose dehydrogenase
MSAIQSERQSSRAGERRALPRVLAIFIGLVALAQGADGGWLIAVGGSPYYLIAAVPMFAGAVFLWQGSEWTRLAFHVVLFGTLIWAWWETDGAAWGMLARVGFILMIWLLVLWATRVSGRPPLARTTPRPAVSGIGVLALLGLMAGHWFTQQTPAATPTSPATPAEQDWPFYGRTQSATRFSPLTQITPANVGKLKVAWIYRTGDLPRVSDKDIEFTFEATPLKIGDTVYLCTTRDILIALDAETGKPRWRFDPQVHDEKTFMKACRGVAYFKADKPIDDCPERILAGTLDGRMVAVDAHTGAPCQSFGSNGQISVLNGFGSVKPGASPS